MGVTRRRRACGAIARVGLAGAEGGGAGVGGWVGGAAEGGARMGGGCGRAGAGASEGTSAGPGRVYSSTASLTTSEAPPSDASTDASKPVSTSTAASSEHASTHCRPTHVSAAHDPAAFAHVDASPSHRVPTQQYDVTAFVDGSKHFAGPESCSARSHPRLPPMQTRCVQYVPSTVQSEVPEHGAPNSHAGEQATSLPSASVHVVSSD